MKIVCPHCGVKGTLADSFIHKNIRCPRCDQIFFAEIEFAPAEETAPPPPPPPPADPPPDPAEEPLQVGLGTLFERRPLCSGCGRQAGEDEDFAPGRIGLLCPACQAAEEEPTDDFAEPVATKAATDWDTDQTAEESADDFADSVETEQALDWGTAQAISGWRREKELRQMAISGMRRTAGANARFTAVPVLREAWEKLRGGKGHIWGAVPIIVLVNLIFAAAIHFLPDMKITVGVTSVSVVGLIAIFLNSLMLSCLGYLGLRRARGEESGADRILVGFAPLNFIKLLLLFILMPIVVGLGLVCLVVPGIYLAVTLSFSPLLVLDKGMWPWQAMRESWRESHAHCLHIFLIYLVAKVAFFAAAILFLVGLFWMLPFVFVLYGVLYRRLFDGT